MDLFTTCVIVASNSAQAAQIRALVSRRCEAGLYPREIDFVVIADPDGGRIGSGGATILAVEAVRGRIERGESVLVIHAGGESRRMPAYAPEGKLFAPLPIPSSSPIPPVILDLQLSLFSKYPWNRGEVVVASGDVVVDFETDLIPRERGDVYGFAKAESFELGSHHGVFKFNRNRTNVIDFFQKAPADYLKDHAALEGARACALDLGTIGFSARGIEALLELARAKATNGERVIDLLRTGTLRFDLYLEILVACLPDLSFDDYREKVASQSSLDGATLRLIFESFRAVGLRGYVARRATFLHFGSLAELPASCGELAQRGVAPFYVHDEAELWPVVSDGVVVVNSSECSVAAERGAGAIFVEGCRDTHIDQAGGENIFRGLSERTFHGTVSRGICVEERNLEGGRVLVAYGATDTWRPAPTLSSLIFCGLPLEAWLTERNLETEEVFPRPTSGVWQQSWDLYDARLFVAEGDEELLEGYWNAGRAGESWRRRFREGHRYTLRELNRLDSVEEREAGRTEIRRRLLREQILSGRGWITLSERDFRGIFKADDVGVLRAMCEGSDDDLVKVYRRRLLATIDSGAPAGDTIAGLRVEYLARLTAPRRLRRGVKLDQIVWARAPVRLDVAGGWTDTPPYTLREGGEVVNVAVDLNGQPPIQVFCRPTEERRICIHSIDLGVRETVDGFASLEDYNSPSSPFALPKAALCLLGLTGEQTASATLGQALDEIGCGLELSLLSAVPKGSGLGTSSILGATILAALERFFGMTIDLGELFRQVLQMEQMLTTGGGWQDQIGGAAGGVKYIESLPGLRPEPAVYRLDPYIFENADSRNRFTLYYTGITRLAKNILQEVVDRVNGFDPSYLFTLRDLKRLARRAREALSLRDLPAVARVLSASWEANKRIHPSTTNDEVEELLGRVAGLYGGMKLLGAGGGGYILFLSKSIEEADRLRYVLSSVEHERARVVEMTLNSVGLQVSVS